MWASGNPAGLAGRTVPIVRGSGGRSGPHAFRGESSFGLYRPLDKYELYLSMVEYGGRFQSGRGIDLDHNGSLLRLARFLRARELHSGESLSSHPAGQETRRATSHLATRAAEGTVTRSPNCLRLLNSRHRPPSESALYDRNSGIVRTPAKMRIVTQHHVQQGIVDLRAPL
jgi:hypothetical protein